MQKERALSISDCALILYTKNLTRNSNNYTDDSPISFFSYDFFNFV